MEQTGLSSVCVIWELGCSAGVLDMCFYIYSLLSNIKWFSFIIITYSVYCLEIKAIVIVMNFN